MSDYKLVLEHHGILGQKWGVRRFQNADGTRTAAGQKRYSANGVRSYKAKRENAKVDKSFQKWKSGSDDRENAIKVGKRANEKRMAYERDRKNKQLKSEYKSANKDYKKAIKPVTTYRKGQVKNEVGKDMSRKYLSEAKKIEKRLKDDPNNKDLQKQYNRMMNKYGVERYNARKAPAKYAARSRAIANTKRQATMAIKATAGTAAVVGGTYAVNRALQSVGKNGINTNDAFTFARVGRFIWDLI